MNHVQSIPLITAYCFRCPDVLYKSGARSDIPEMLFYPERLTMSSCLGGCLLADKTTSKSNLRLPVSG